MFEQFLNKRRYKTARRKADRLGRTVSAVQDESGVWRYFLTDPDASEVDVAAAAFNVRNGRDMNKNERRLLEIALEEWQ